MHETFATYINELPVLLSKLLDMVPVRPSKLPKEIPLKGIYLISENGNHTILNK